MRIEHLGLSFEINADISAEQLEVLQERVTRVLASVQKENTGASTALQQAILGLYHLANACVELEEQHTTTVSQLTQAAKITDAMLLKISDIV